MLWLGSILKIADLLGWYSNPDKITDITIHRFQVKEILN